jgi:hypothetical protein
MVAVGVGSAAAAEDGMSGRARVGVAIAAGVGVAAVFLALDHTSSLATRIGARPLLMAVGLGALVTLALIAILAPDGTRKPALAMSKPGLVRILLWWAGLAAALLTVAFASWRQWNLLFLAGAVVAIAKALSLISYIKRDYAFHVWEPFAVVLGSLLFLASIVGFTGRPNVPPPFDAIVLRFAADPTTSSAATRDAPDLSSAGFTLTSSGDVRVGGLPTTYYSFQSSNDSRVDVYVSRIVFPLPRGSTKTTDPPGWWTKEEHLYVRTANTPVHFVAVSDDQDSVDAFVKAYASSGT